jgi:ATP-dependent DNA ligase
MKAGFVEPMECLSVSKLPEGSNWLWELKLDAFRAIAVKSDQKVHLYSRNGKSFDKKFSPVVEALRELPDETTIDGEIVALDDSGRPNFNLLQNFVSETGRIRYFVFTSRILEVVRFARCKIKHSRSMFGPKRRVRTREPDPSLRNSMY